MTPAFDMRSQVAECLSHGADLWVGAVGTINRVLSASTSGAPSRLKTEMAVEAPVFVAPSPGGRA